MTKKFIFFSFSFALSLYPSVLSLSLGFWTNPETGELATVPTAVATLLRRWPPLADELSQKRLYHEEACNFLFHYFQLVFPKTIPSFPNLGFWFLVKKLFFVVCFVCVCVFRRCDVGFVLVSGFV